jgi:hypothetical protein
VSVSLVVRGMVGTWHGRYQSFDRLRRGAELDETNGNMPLSANSGCG